MTRNVEIKARVQNLEVVKRCILDLKSNMLNKGEGVAGSVLMEQEDIFYNLPAGNAGKLKLRKIKVGYIPNRNNCINRYLLTIIVIYNI